MKKFALGFFAGFCVIPIVVWLYFKLGLAPAATSAPPMPFEKRMARMALHARIDKEAPKEAPGTVPANEQTFVAGAKLYKQHCADCHGLPGQPLPAMAQGMFPKPPHLMNGHGVTHDPVGETYWMVANGVRLTGMPAFDKVMSEEQMWQVSLMLANANALPGPAKDALK
jgi:mono/diheme cytochrome c family protein